MGTAIYQIIIAAVIGAIIGGMILFIRLLTSADIKTPLS